MLGPLALLLSGAAGLPHLLAVSIPIWNEYVGFVKWALDSLAQLLGSGGLAIIAFTIVVKTLILPVTVQSIRSSKAMQELQPKIKELQKKHGKDRQRLSQETMALYQAHRVNPMAGCLPMVLQIPIFLGVYQAIFGLSTAGAGVWKDAFLWLPNLSKPDPIHLLPVLAAIFQFVQSRMMRPYKQGKIADPQQAMMNSLMNVMPLTVILFGLNFASGAVLYWATQSVYSVVQQWFITGWGSMRDWFEHLPELPEHRRLGYRPPRSLDDVVVVGGDGAAAAPRGVMGWLQSRMNEAQKQVIERGTPAVDAAQEDEAERQAEPARAATRPSNGSGRSRNGAPGRSKNGATVVQRGRQARGGAAPEPAAGSPKAIVVPRKARPSAGQGK